jgi:hypothetical protein
LIAAASLSRAGVIRMDAPSVILSFAGSSALRLTLTGGNIDAEAAFLHRLRRLARPKEG